MARKYDAGLQCCVRYRRRIGADGTPNLIRSTSFRSLTTWSFLLLALSVAASGCPEALNPSVPLDGIDQDLDVGSGSTDSDEGDDVTAGDLVDAQDVGAETSDLGFETGDADAGEEHAGQPCFARGSAMAGGCAQPGRQAVWYARDTR